MEWSSLNLTKNSYQLLLLNLLLHQEITINEQMKKPLNNQFSLGALINWKQIVFNCEMAQLF